MAIDFYLDFVSSFGYLARGRLLEIAGRYGQEVRYHPVEIARIRALAGSTGPSNGQIPLKLAYSKIDQKRWAKRYGIPVTTPAHYDGSRLNRGLYFARARNQAHDYLKLAFHKVWGEGSSMVDEAMLRSVATQLGWDADEFLRFTLSSEADAQWKAATVDAHNRGVFGVPSMLIGDELWWGNDRLDFLEDYLEKHRAA